MKIQTSRDSVSDAYIIPGRNNILLEWTWNGVTIDYQMFSSNLMHN